MYIPSRYAVTDPAAIEAFIHEHDFAALVSVKDGLPLATHLPMEWVTAADGQRYLYGHVARANPHWRALEAQPGALAIFAGPHTYISPRWYDHPNVPTWNYMTAHVYGQARLIHDPDELYPLLKRLVDRYEANSGATPVYQLETLPPDLVAKQIRGIVGIEIAVERIEAKFKLSQNRNRRDFETIIAELQQHADGNAYAPRIAEAMQLMIPSLYGEKD